MPEGPNFLLGYGERLTAPIEPVHGGQELPPHWTFVEARERLVPMVSQTAVDIAALPRLACPRDEAVAILTLHPESLAKSYHPGSMLREVGLEAVGSRPSYVQPEKWRKKRQPESVQTTDLFIAGPRDAFKRWARLLPQWQEGMVGAKDLFRIETLRAATVEDRLRLTEVADDEVLLEVVLHATGLPESNYILEGFEAFLEALRLEVQADFDRRLYAGGLCFLPLLAPQELIREVATFSFLRVARPMPRLRPIAPVIRSVQPAKSFACTLPKSGPLDPMLRVAVFDGGFPEDSELARWVEAREATGIGEAVEDWMLHGHDVASALLFGPLENGKSAAVPYAFVDHYRVLDEASADNVYELYDALKRIREVLQRREYEFVNFSIGPDVPIVDDDVHSWTAVLDEYLSTGDVLATIAVGNGGANDRESGNARIQSPADCVNALAVGASNSRGKTWKRASYSSVGPGRSPGVVKPDVLGFGGDEKEPFWVVDSTAKGKTAGTCGTSLSTPAVLRIGLGVRAHFGKMVKPLGIKSLIINSTEDGGLARHEHGWGRVPENLDDLVICPEGIARVLYQGELTAAQYIRARIPLPTKELTGLVTIRATFCFATETDPQDPSNYTRSGLEIVFRPHDGKFSKDSHHPKSAAFFQLKEFSTEAELRRDAHKWETTLHREKTFRGSSLQNPMFDIHYNARTGGAPAAKATKIRYALVVTVISPKTADLYDRIVRRYPTILRPLMPVIQIPVRT